MLYRGLLATDLSGKLDGLVASRNRGGAYIREHVTPIDPATARQLIQRTAMENASAAWSALTDAQRQLWNTWAMGLRMVNRAGRPYAPTGRHAFFAEYLPRAQVALTPSSLVPGCSPLFALPITPPSQPFRGPTFPPIPRGRTVTDPADSFPFRLSEDDWWMFDEETALLVFTGPDLPPTRYWFRGPYQLRLAMIGNEDGYDGVDFWAQLPWAPDVGDPLFYRFVLTSSTYGTAEVACGRWPYALA
jgi:hypothetical protein